MGLIIGGSMLCALCVLIGIEFIRHQLRRRDAEGHVPHWHLKSGLAGIWVALWLVLAAYGAFEFFTNSEAYFGSVS